MEENKLTAHNEAFARERQTQLIEIIEALNSLEQTKEWDTIKRLVYAPSLASIERQLMSESLKPEIRTDKLYKLQGEWDWAKKFSDTSRFTEILKKELAEIKKLLKSNE